MFCLYIGGKTGTVQGTPQPLKGFSSDCAGDSATPFVCFCLSVCVCLCVCVCVCVCVTNGPSISMECNGAKHLNLPSPPPKAQAGSAASATG